MDYQTADLCDKHEERVRAGELRVLEPMLNSYGGREAFHGRIATLKLHEDNSLVRKALESPGEGRVLVIDGGGSLRCALVGDQLAALGVKSGWAGIVVYGCIRDSRVIEEMDIGVLALLVLMLNLNNIATALTGGIGLQGVGREVAALADEHDWRVEAETAADDAGRWRVRRR